MQSYTCIPKVFSLSEDEKRVKTNLVFLKFSFDPFRSVGAFKQFNLFKVAKFGLLLYVFSMFYDQNTAKKKFV